MNTKQEYENEISKMTVKMAAHGTRIDGLKTLYGAACFAGDGVEAQKLREAIQVEFDHMLDAHASIMTMMRKSFEVGHG